MLFNSIDFAVFLPIVYILYWLIFNKMKVDYRNLFLLVVSYIFYAFWDWRFIVLIVISSLADFFIGIQLDKTDDTKKRKYLLITSLVVNLGILGFFKYYNFFIDSFIDTFKLFGTDFSYAPLNIILPVGISFYTFQSLNYTIEIHRRTLKPSHNVIRFLSFISFFPQLVAGPIERAKDLLPQFDDRKIFNYDEARSGLMLIAIGLFKKIVISDRLGVFVNKVYGNLHSAEGIVLFWGVVFFAFQLYLDFSAYSQIAKGTARILGFNLSDNFRRPYLSKSFSSFWSRWHITLSTWMRDYIYIPLGGNRKGNYRTVINTLIVFAVSGLWHGASWNFVIWGLLNGLFLIVFDRVLKLEKSKGLKSLLSPFLVLAMWALSLVFFRAPNFSDALYVFKNIGFSNLGLYDFGLNANEFRFTLFLIASIILTEMIAEHHIPKIKTWFWSSNTAIRWSVYLILILTIIFLGSYGSANDNSFIYFQF